MNEKLAKFYGDLMQRLDAFEMQGQIVSSSENECRVALSYKGGDIYIASYETPGLTIAWLGEHTLSDFSVTELVRVNGVLFEASAALHVASWVVGS